MQFSFLFEMQLLEKFSHYCYCLLLCQSGKKDIQNLKNPSSTNIPSCFLYSWIAAVMTVRYGIRRVWKMETDHTQPCLRTQGASPVLEGKIQETWQRKWTHLECFGCHAKFEKCITLLQNLCIVTTNFLKFYFLLFSEIVCRLLLNILLDTFFTWILQDFLVKGTYTPRKIMWTWSS